MVSAVICASHTTGLDLQFRGSWFGNSCQFSLKKLEFYSTKLCFSIAKGDLPGLAKGEDKKKSAARLGEGAKAGDDVKSLLEPICGSPP